MTAIYCILSLIAGALIVYFVLRPKLKTVQELDKTTAEQNEELRLQLSSLMAKKETIIEALNDLEDQAKRSAEAAYQNNFALANQQFEIAAEQRSQQYQIEEANFQEEYLNTMSECANQFVAEIAAKRQELSNLNGQIADVKLKIDASVEAAKRAEEIRISAQFYKLNLSEEDIEEIHHLRTVIPFLRNQEPLNKVIWKVYYEKPTSDLIGRVIGSGIHTGIYKITNLENDMCYIGQAANLADRWKQHIKRGIGADAPTRNKLYPAMLAIGVENFSFEIIEECSREMLDAREDYWQEFFKAKEFGYSIK